MKLNKLIYMGAMTLALASCTCSSDLEEAPADLLSSNGFYQTTAQATQGVLGVYADLRYLSDYEYGMMSEVRSDNIWVNPEPNGQRDYSDIGSFRADATCGTFESTWNAWYKVIYDANVAIQKISSAKYDNETVQKQLLNEAHFLRGWAYFELVRLYGNVPMITEPVSPSTANGTEQTDGKTIIEKVVIPDLEMALNLPDKGNILNAVGTKVPEQGRADCTAAAAMLARVYMTLAGFPFNDESASTKAETYIDQVLAKTDANGYWAKDITEWRKQFTPDGNNLYSVFAIQYRTGGTGNPMQFNQTKSLPPSYTNGVGVRLFGNDVYLEIDLRHDLDSDPRGAGWTFLDGYPAEANTVAYSTTYGDYTKDGVTYTGVVDNAIVYKNLPSKPKMDGLGLTMDYSALKDYEDWPVNLAIIRIEDIMLYKAELLATQGKVSEALTYVNKIRERVGCTPVAASNAAAALKAVRNERRLEFMGEGIRWFDEVRYNTWKSDIVEKFARHNNPSGTSTGDVKDGRYLYPIPQNQMNISPGTYEQNEGY